MFVSAVRAAAGGGRRFGGHTAKQFLEISGKPVLVRAIEPFERCERVGEIIVVAAPDAMDYCQTDILGRYGFKKAVLAPGGNTRQESVLAGLARCCPKTDVVLIHDGARPFVAQGDIIRVIEAAAEFGCSALGVPVADTVKICDSQGIVISTPERECLRAAQTPQGFRFAVIKAAYDDARASGYTATDDCAAAERMGLSPMILQGKRYNIKITTPEDMAVAHALLPGFEGGLYEEC